MTELIIRSQEADAVRSELESAIETQRKTIRDSLRRTQAKLASLETRHGFETKELLARELDGVLDDSDLEFIEWLGEARTVERLEDELRLLEDIRICS